MNAKTLRSANPPIRLLSTIAIIIATLWLTFGITAGQAYAIDAGVSESPVNNPVAQNGNSDEGPAPATEVEPAASSALNAANDMTYPGDDSSMDAFIGLAPTSSKTVDISGAPTTRDQATNAVYVDLQFEVGQAIDLAVAVDYVRFGDDVYDSRNSSGSVSAAVPQEETDEYSTTYTKDGAVYTWYSTQSPLGQGTYYSDPSTNPALLGGSVGQAADLASYDVNLEDFIEDRGASWRRGKDKIAVRPTQFRFDGTLLLPEKCEVGADGSYRYMQSPFYFEEPGQYTFLAQFTLMREYHSKNTVDENVGYVLYASNPVVYRITVTNRPVVTVHVEGFAQDKGAIQFTNDDEKSGLQKHKGFYVDLEKLYYVDPQVESDPFYPPELKQMSYKYTWCNRNLLGHYEYATPGTYRLTVVHEDGDYYKYVDDNFVISEDDYNRALSSQDHTIPVFVELIPAPPVMYTITFYLEEGGAPLSSAQYKKGTAAENIIQPERPTKPATEYYSYEFEDWEAVPLNGGQLDWGSTRINYVYPVTCDTNYIAVFKETLLKNDQGQKIAYATGGLFSNDALPNGVLGYALSSEQVSASQQASIVAAHSDTIDPNRVLGMVQVDLKQYNDDEDKTTTNVTESEGLNGMQLKFNMQEMGIDVADGDNLTVLQIHKPSQNGPEEIIEHQATVENGEVNITLDGRLSTFVFLRAASDEPGSGDSGGDTPHESGDDPTGGSSDGGSGGESAEQPAQGQTDGGAGSGSDSPSSEEPSGNDRGQASVVETTPETEPASERDDAVSGEVSPGTANAAGDAATGATDEGQIAQVRAMAPLKTEEASEHDAREVRVEDVKAAPAPADAALPETGDSSSAVALALALIALFALAFSLRARRA